MAIFAVCADFFCINLRPKMQIQQHFYPFYKMIISSCVKNFYFYFINFQYLRIYFAEKAKK